MAHDNDLSSLLATLEHHLAQMAQALASFRTSCTQGQQVTPYQDTLIRVPKPSPHALEQMLLRAGLNPDQDVRIAAENGTVTVRTTHQLERPLWRSYHDLLKSQGLKWISADENSRWEVAA